MRYASLRGEDVPALGLGTWQLEGAQCRRTIEEALDVGYRHFDTAQAYGNEADIGAALRTTTVDRGDVFLTTKVSNRNLAADKVRASTEDSLRRLGSDYVDLLLIHWPVAFERVGETLEAMGRLHDDGKVRYLGVSNFTASQLARAAELAPVACDQVEYHPFLGQAAVLEVARKNDALVTAYSPLARGKVFDDPTLREIAERHHKSPGQVALRWLLDQEDVMAVPKASGREHLQSNFDIFDFQLSDADRERIDGLQQHGERTIDPPFAPWNA